MLDSANLMIVTIVVKVESCVWPAMQPVMWRIVAGHDHLPGGLLASATVCTSLFALFEQDWHCQVGHMIPHAKQAGSLVAGTLGTM